MSAFRESDSRGRLPLHAAAVQPQRDVLHVVLQGESSVQLNAVDVAYLETRQLLHTLLGVFVPASVSTELTLEEQTEDGDTSLTLAAEAGLVENVKMLLQHGASPHNTNSRNESPLLIGSTHTHTQKSTQCTQLVT